MMELDGSNQTDVSESESAWSYSPQFTPDGSQIVFMIGPYDRLIIMDADGSNQTNFTNNPSYDHYPQFQPQPK